ncbi:MAG: alginate O-acetyltransferase complex protein AlgJ [Myxococcales bacterium]|jgi:hypothetical protein|nr:alginate O-acetyltransferase complex protein AlgJ [Myxococcales bacterium]
MTRRGNLVLSLLFLTALAVPAFDLVFKLDPNPSPLQDEITFPSFHLDRRAVRFPGELLIYLKNAMGFRATLVRVRALIAWRVLGVSSAPESVIRADPWLFLAGERMVDNFRRVSPFTDRELETWRSVLKARADWLAQRGIRYMVVVAPDKESIYREFVPPWLTRVAAPSRLEQLRQAAATTPGVELLDLSDALERHKDEERLYYLSDTHWNDRGAFFGYQAIAGRLAAWFPDVKMLTDHDFTRQAVVTAGGDLARMSGLKNDITEPQVHLRLSSADRAATFADGSPLTFERMSVRGRKRFETRSRLGEIPSATIIRDSFGEALIPFLASHFQSATWLWSYDFSADVIDQQRPTVVIQELVERKLMEVQPKNPDVVGTGRGASH